MAPIDPAQGFSADDDGRRAERLADLERRLARLETGAPVVQSGLGPPPIAAGTLRTGTAYIDTTGAGRLYYVVAGVWRSVALA